jgi:hypothetical protein
MEGLADTSTVTGVSRKFANTPKIHTSGDVSEKNSKFCAFLYVINKHDFRLKAIYQPKVHR